jgi:hypothetical protein
MIRSAPGTSEKIMPEKQTREGIEAELNASESERISFQLQEVVREAEFVEKDLRALEDEHRIPEFARSRPLPERMAAVGMSRAGVERLSTFLDALSTVRRARLLKPLVQFHCGRSGISNRKRPKARLKNFLTARSAKPL